MVKCSFALSERSLRIKESPLYVLSAKLAAMRATGIKDVISLGIGEPQDRTPDIIGQAGIDAINNGITQYMPIGGGIALREAIGRKYGVGKDNVVVTSGAKLMLSVVLSLLINPGDDVVVVAPYYPPFVEVIRSLGGNVRFVNTREKDGFQFRARAVERVIKKFGVEKVKAVIINSPNNPTGAVYERTELELLARMSRKYDFMVVSDECYDNFVDSHLCYREIDSESIVIGSTSKTYAMPGWRIGWAIMPDDITRAAITYISHYVGPNCSISESAALVATTTAGIDGYGVQRQMVLSWLKEIGVDLQYRPAGAFYVFADFSKIIKRLKIKDGGMGLAVHLLENANVLVTPGSAFGEYKNYVRIAFCVNRETLKEALQRMKKVLK